MVHCHSSCGKADYGLANQLFFYAVTQGLLMDLICDVHRAQRKLLRFYKRYYYSGGFQVRIVNA